MPTAQRKRQEARRFFHRIRHYYHQGIAEILESVAMKKTCQPVSTVPTHSVQEVSRPVSCRWRRSGDNFLRRSELRGSLRVINPELPLADEVPTQLPWVGSTSTNTLFPTGDNAMTELRCADEISPSSMANPRQVHELEACVPATLGVGRRTNRKNNAQPSTRVSNATSTGYKGTEAEWKRWSLYKQLAETG